MLIPMLIHDDYYQIIDPDELIDQQYIETMESQDNNIAARTIPEMYQPLFITDDFKAVFRPAALDLFHVNPEQSVQAIVPSLNIVVQFKWRFELMANLALLVLEIETPPFTSIRQINDLIDIAQHDSFTWDTKDGWLLPHQSISQMLDIPENEPVGLANLVYAFEKFMNARAIIKAQHPFTAFLLQMNIRGGHEFYEASSDFGEYLLEHRYRHLSALLGYHENQIPFEGINWHFAQKLDSCAWFEWQPPKHRDTPLVQHRHAAGNIYTSNSHRRRAVRRIFTICTMEYIMARLIAHLFASDGEAKNLRSAIHKICQDKQRNSALYHDIIFKLSRLESRYVLLNTNLTNPDWVLENPFGEGSDFINLMRYVNNAYGTQAHLSALRQQLDLFNQLLDRCT